MNNRTQSLFVGFTAGLASAVLLLGSGGVSALSLILALCAMLPILIAGLGWSNYAGGVAVVVATLLIAVFVSPLDAVRVAASTLVPAAWIAHLSNLARPADEVGGEAGQLVWYPLSGILFQICGLVSLFLIIAGTLINYSEETLRPMVEFMFSTLGEQYPEMQLSDDERDAVLAETTRSFTRLMPAMAAGYLVLFQFTSWYVACAIVRVSGRAKRPADYIPAELRMPQAALLVLGVGMVLMLIGGTAGLIGGVITGAVGCGFILSGLAILHQKLASKPWKLMALWFVYTAIIIFQLLPLIIFMFAGMLGTFGTARPASPGSGPDNSNDQSN